MRRQENTSIFLKMQVTVAELKVGLARLGYRLQMTSEHYLIFLHQHSKHEFLIPNRVSENDFVPPLTLLSGSSLMVDFGVLKHQKELATLLLDIQKERSSEALAA